MKKTLALLGLLLMLMLPTVALAEGEAATPTPATPTTSARTKPALTPEEKALREGIAASRQTLKTLRTQANTLTQENKALGLQVKTGLKAVKDGTKTPTSPERIAELIPQLKAIRDSIKATEGQVREHMQSARASIAAKDFTAAKASIDEAIKVEESRIALKQQVNATLKELVGLLG